MVSVGRRELNVKESKEGVDWVFLLQVWAVASFYERGNEQVS